MRRTFILAMALVASCKSQPTRLADELDRSSSWLAAIAEIGHRSSENSVPVRYAQDAIGDAAAELDKAASSLSTISGPSDIASEGRRLIAASTAHLDVLRADLAAGATDMHGTLAWLTAAADTLGDLGERARSLK
jgi:hypothetical protein